MGRAVEPLTWSGGEAMRTAGFTRLHEREVTRMLPGLTPAVRGAGLPAPT
jgi:hypothetical protein